MNNLSIIILTLNEEKNIENSIKSALKLTQNVFIVDSFSIDNTISIINKYKVKFIQQKFESFSNQIIFGIKHFGISTEWIFRLDADEVLSDHLITEIKKFFSGKLIDKYDGIAVKFRINFMGKNLLFGRLKPLTLTRFVKTSNLKMTNSMLDEKFVLSNKKRYSFKNFVIHHDFKSLESMILKHLKYANYEINDIKLKKSKSFSRKVYYLLPLFFRAHLYFLIRYFLLLGFLDGKEGLIYLFIQSYWFRFFVDSKIFEIRKNLNG